MATKYKVSLNEIEITKLKSIIKKGKHSARTINRARVLLMTNEHKVDRQIYETLHLAKSTPGDIRRRYCEGGLIRSLYDAPRPGQPRAMTIIEEAKIVAIACTEPEDGYSKWSMDLLTKKVNQELAARKRPLGRTTIYNVLLRNELKPWQKKNVVHS